MRRFGLSSLVVVFVVLTVLGGGVFVYAAGDAGKGKTLFNDPELGGGTSGKSCNTCHPNGKGLEMSASKSEIMLMGMKLNSIEEAVNMCIEKPMQGTAIDPKGAEMMDIVAYLKSLAGDAMQGKTLFNDPKLGGGTSGKSCNTCHPDGKGLEMSASKSEIMLMGMKLNSIEEAVNMCIEKPMQGKAIDPKGAEMMDIVAYLKSLAKP